MPIPTMKSNEPEFSIDTAELGRIDVLPLTIGRMSEIEKTKAETSASFMNNLIASIGRKNDGTELTDNDVAKLSDTDREVFAKQVLEFNQYLFRERVVEQHERDEGGVVVSFRDGNVKHQKEEDESDSDYLFRLFKIQKAKLKEQKDRMLAPFADMSKAYRQRFSPSFLEAFTRSQSATAQLGKMIDRLRVNIPGVPATAATPSAPDRIEVYQPEVRVPDLLSVR